MKLLLLDIETAPNIVYCWGLYDQNIAINQIIASGYTLCYAAKWYGKSGVYFDSVRQSKPAKMLKGVHALLNEADAVIHYNGTTFDIPTLNKEFLLHYLPPPAPYKQIDLYRTVKSQFRFPSKKLDYISQELGYKGKVHHKGQAMWTGCMNGDDKAWRVMERYNRGDVTELEKVYTRVMPWIRNHPNHGLYDEPGLPVCPSCGSAKLQRRGFARTTVAKYARMQCSGCGAWSRDTHHELPTEDRKMILRADRG